MECLFIYQSIFTGCLGYYILLPLNSFYFMYMHCMDTQLYKAAVEGNINPFRDITARELDSIVTPNKNTILHINIMSRNRSSMETASTKFVEDILDRCPSLLLQVNVNAETPLHVAAKCGHSDMVEFLIKSTAKTHDEDLESDTVECLIKSTAKTEDEDLEIGIGASRLMLRMTNNEGNTALHEAVKYEHLDVVKILTKEDPDFTYTSNNRGETPLYIAAAKHSLKVVVEILQTCTTPAHEGPDQMTALHVAAMSYNQDITREILEKKKSLIKEIDQHGWTPLHYAAYHRNLGSMEALLECDVSTAYVGDKHRKMTPLHLAIGQGYIPQVLLSRCPDCCELVDKRRWNVLHFAMLSFKNLEILLKEYPLIRNLINDKDIDGNTPLHLLAIFRPHLIEEIRKDYVKYISLDLGVVNNQNMSAYEMKIKSGSHQLKEEILKLEEPARPYLDGIVRVQRKEPSRGGGGDRDKWKEEEIKEFEKMKESHLIVAALIATVTFTAAFTLPGGVIQDGDNKGTAILSKRAAFQAFVITDAIALVLSLSAVFAHFLMSLWQKVTSIEQSVFLLLYGALSTMIAMGAMVIAFVTGTYAVLTTSLWLAILTTLIGFSFFILMCLIVIGMMRANQLLDWLDELC